jgi:hypothetical protein
MKISPLARDLMIKLVEARSKAEGRMPEKEIVNRAGGCMEQHQHRSLFQI